MMYNLGKGDVYKNAMDAKKARLQRCSNTKHSKFMIKYREVTKDKFFLKQFPGIVVPQAGCNYPVLGGWNPFYVSLKS